jgi:hypothetical protein
MFDALPKAVKISLIFSCAVFALMLFVKSKERVYTDRENYRAHGPSTYDVWDLEIRSANRNAGETFRVAVVNDRRYSQPDFIAFGEDGLDERVRNEVGVGQTQELRLPRLRFKSLHSDSFLELEPLKNQNEVVFRATRIKSCPVEVSEEEQTKIVNKGSGVIAVPTLVKKTVRKFTQPVCADPADATFNQATSAAAAADPQIIKAIADAKAQEKEREVHTERARREAELTRKIHAQVAAVPKELIDPAGLASDSFEHAVCSRFAGLMRALGISEVNASRTQTVVEQSAGMTRYHTENHVEFRLKDGQKYSRDPLVDGHLFDVAQSISLDDKTCVRVQASPQGTARYDANDKALDELAHLIDVYIRDLTREQAARELPLPAK